MIRKHRIEVLAIAMVLLMGPSGVSDTASREAQAHLQSGMSRMASGKFSEAIGEFEQALSFNPDFAEAHFYLSQAYAQTEGWEKARQHIDQAIGLDRSAPAYLNQRAMIFVQQKRFKDALPDLL